MSLSDATSPAKVTFEDTLGTRVHMQPVAGADALDLLWFDERVAALPSFEFALRERVGRLDQFRDAHFVAIRGVDRSASTRMRLVLIADHAPGIRLSQLLAEAERSQRHLDIMTALSIVRHLAAAIAMLHEHAPGIAHGAICPERIAITPNGRLVLLEHVLGSAIEQLRYSPARYWRELGIAFPPAAGGRIDQRTDVFQAGVVLLSLLLGRALDRTYDPGEITHLIPAAINRPDLQPFGALCLGLHDWLGRALQLNAAQEFASGLDAWAALDEVLANDRILVAGAIQVPIAAGAITDHGRGTAPTQLGDASRQSAREDVRPLTRMNPTGTAAHETARVNVRTAAREHALNVAPVTGLARRNLRPRSLAPRSLHSESSLSLRPTLLDMSPAVPPVAEADEIAYGFADDRGLTSQWWRQLAGAALAAAICVPIGAAAFFGGHTHAATDGTVTLRTNPPGARAVIDGTARGVTPLTLSLTAGTHTLELRGGGASRTLPLTISSGADVSQYVELPQRPSHRGELEVRTDPSGAQIRVDDVSIGQSPMRLDLGAGTHHVVVERNGAKVAQDVRIQPSTTASLLVPLTARPSPAQFGWVSIKAPLDVQVYERGQLLGTSESARLMMAAGIHNVDIVNDVLGYRAARTVQIAPGQVTQMQVDFPLGSVQLTATPSADVWLDGQRVGSTPIDNLPVRIGPHEILFRNPQLGDRHYVVTVTEAQPLHLNVDLAKK